MSGRAARGGHFPDNFTEGPFMFIHLEKLPDDPILQLSQLFRADPRTPKLDLGVGIFQNERGETPIMRAVKAAEGELLQTENSKKYIGLLGNAVFNQAMIELVLGASVSADRVRAIQATAGTGAVRLIASVLASLLPEHHLYVSDPTWGNHQAIFQAAGFQPQTYPYYDRQHSVVDRERFFAALEQFGPRDIVLLHGCCHNPSGADLSPADWQRVAEIASRRGWLPVVDLAYQGLGEDLQADALGVRTLAAAVPNLFVAVSGSKNFGLYRERVGVVLMLGQNATEAEALQSHFGVISRAMVSMPPDHGAAIVGHVLTTPALRADWEAELNEMSAYIRRRRQELVAALERRVGGDWHFITDVHRGMFSLLPLGKERVKRLREDFAIYIVGEGRINIAGLKSAEDCAYLADALAKVL